MLVRAQSRGELPLQVDLLLLIGHLHALYIVVLSSFYLRDIETLEEAQMMLYGLVKQTLEGPAVMPYASEAEQDRWNELKQLVLRRRNLELS